VGGRVDRSVAAATAAGRVVNVEVESEACSPIHVHALRTMPG
jgi:hypothetical protein